MDTPEHIWKKLTNKLEDSTHTVENIRSVSVKIRNGGIVATTIRGPDQEFDSENEGREPLEDQDIDEILEKTKEEIEDIKTNESVFIYEDFGIELKNIVYNKVRNIVRSTPTITSCEIRRVTVTKESINPVVHLEKTVPCSRTNLYEKFSQILSDEGLLESEDEFSHGTIDSVYYSDMGISEGWSFDGTLYRLMEEPWSERDEEDYPDDEEEWAEFTSDTESSKIQSMNRDYHLMHFHPMQTGLNDDHPFIKWFENAERIAKEDFEIDNDQAMDFSLKRVELDEVRVVLGLSIVLD